MKQNCTKADIVVWWSIRGIAALFLLITVFSGRNAAALDRVFLKDASIVEGTIIRRDKDIVMIRTSAGIRQIQRANISSIVTEEKTWSEIMMEESGIEHQKEQEDFIKPEDVKAIREGKVKNPLDDTGTNKPRPALTGVPKRSTLYRRAFTRADAPLEAKIISTIKSLKTRKIPDTVLVFFKENADAAAPYLVLFMWDQDNYYVAYNAVKLLGVLNRKDAIKYMLEALYAMMPVEGRHPAPGIADLMDAVQSSLDTITADYRTAGIYANPNSAYVSEEIARWLEWYAQVITKIPPQIGEGKLPDPSAGQDYVTAVEKERGLDISLVAQSWPVPALKEISLEYKFPPVSAADRQRLDELFKRLGSDDSSVRRTARLEMEQLAPQHIDERTLMVYLVMYGLTSDSYNVKISTVMQLAKLNSKPAIRYIIEAMMKTMGPDKPPAPEEQKFVEESFRTLEKITGITTFNAPRYRAQAYKRCYKWVEWYQQNRGNAALIPPQLSEPTLDPAMDNYTENYLKVRSLNVANLPPD